MDRFKNLQINHATLRLISAFVLASMLLFLISSCGIAARTRKLFGDKQEIKIDISAKLNEDHPIAIDLVHVYDEKLLEMLREMPAKTWFAKRQQIKRDYRLGVGLDCWQKEWVPGQSIDDYNLPLKPKAKGAFVFANYYTPGEHRFSIDPFDDIEIYFFEKDFVVKVQE